MLDADSRNVWQNRDTASPRLHEKTLSRKQTALSLARSTTNLSSKNITSEGLSFERELACAPIKIIVDPHDRKRRSQERPFRNVIRSFVRSRLPAHCAAPPDLVSPNAPTLICTQQETCMKVRLMSSAAAAFQMQWSAVKH